jgi:hypothetical protein
MLSDEWKTEALKRFPELQENCEEADNPYLLWFELRDAFEQAYVAPRNESMIRRIYEYYEWCAKAPRGKTAEDDLLTCVSVCFLEHIPETPEALKDMPRWFNREDVLKMKEIFSYMVGEDGYATILARFNEDRGKGERQ